ncbi:MAG: M48 family metallopeptidase [Syntrophotaleaceae bacterium]
MARWRLLLLLALFALGGSLAVQLARQRVQTPLESTLTRTYQVLGRPVQSLDRAFSRIIPIDSLDEKEFGEAIAARYASAKQGDAASSLYLQELVDKLAVFAKKPFNYRVFLLPTEVPNACALPGGVMLVTEGLLEALGSEAELVAVLAHEMGHIERGHCLAAVKYQVLFQKLKAPSLGKLADFAVGVMLRHAFSKTQENEADDYAFALLLQTPYDPAAVGAAFVSLQAYPGRSRRAQSGPRHADPVRDYFMTHPQLVLRQEKYAQQGHLWWRQHPTAKRYGGVTNLQRRESFYSRPLSTEWRHRGTGRGNGQSEKKPLTWTQAERIRSMNNSF